MKQAMRSTTAKLKLLQLIDAHKDELHETKVEYNILKKSLDDCRASEVDTDYMLQESKKLLKEWEMKVKAFKKKLENLQVDLAKHMDQIQRDAVDPDKLQATLNDESLNDVCDLKKSIRNGGIARSSVETHESNLDSISEYRKKAQLYNERVEELNVATRTG